MQAAANPRCVPRPIAAPRPRHARLTIAALLIAAVVAAAMLGGCEDPPPPTDAFEAQAPEGWTTQRPHGHDIAYLSPSEGDDDTYQESILISVVPIPPEKVDDPSFLEPPPVEQMARGKQDFELLASGSGTIDSRPAQWVKTRYVTEGQPTQTVQWVATWGTTGYFITLSATPESFDRYEPQLQSLLESFRFVRAEELTTSDPAAVSEPGPAGD
jgi:hypothetical protein